METSDGNWLLGLCVEEWGSGDEVVVVNRGVPRGGCGAGAGVMLKPESVGAVFAILSDSWN